MEQSTDRSLCDGIRHLTEHIVSLHLILNQRISLSISLKSDSLTELIHIINMIHPTCINYFQQDDTLHFSELFSLRELCFFTFIRLDSTFFQQMLQFLLSHLTAFFFWRKFHLRDHSVKIDLETFNIPFFRINFCRSKTVCHVLHIFGDHTVDRISHTLTIQHTTTLRVNDLSLLIHNLIVL